MVLVVMPYTVTTCYGSVITCRDAEEYARVAAWADWLAARKHAAEARIAELGLCGVPLEAMGRGDARCRMPSPCRFHPTAASHSTPASPAPPDTECIDTAVRAAFPPPPPSENFRVLARLYAHPHPEIVAPGPT